MLGTTSATILIVRPKATQVRVTDDTLTVDLLDSWQ
jgi:hypothetical protein